ncbi:MAG: microviridin/marinostatin family tricyclic proteinase inhibitor [Chitinophagaceae bacterium]
MNQTEIKQPFFVKFLEVQKTDECQNSPTKPTLDMEHTLKYPSDGDETWDYATA